MSAPAYAAVDARRNFAPPMGLGPATMHPPPPKPRVWPGPVRDWVSRAFAEDNQIPGIGREELEVKLKQIITDAHVSSSLEAIQWNTYPLPQQLLQQERAVRYAASPYPPPGQPPQVNGYPPSGQPQFSGGYPGYGQPQASVASGKRKSSSDSPGYDDTPPWRRGAKAPRLNHQDDRTGHKSKKQEKRERQRLRANQHFSGPSKFQEDLEKRRQRFQNNASAAQSPFMSSSGATPEPVGHVVGRSQALEKNYFRLTGPAKPEEVRPQAVLEKTIELLKQKWKADGNYGYMCDQLKSMRQDLTVQHIKNSFTVQVYELHARIALEKSDIGEYNQCQTQLRALHGQRLGGHPAEFLAYRILYTLLTGNRTAMNELLAVVNQEDKKDPAVQHALAIRSALALGNYHRFFKLSLDVPNLGAYLLDVFIKRERLAALANMCTSYRPHVNIKFLTEELGFETHQHTFDFLKEYAPGEVFQETNDSYLLKTKEAAPFIEVARANAFMRVDIKGQI